VKDQEIEVFSKSVIHNCVDALFQLQALLHDGNQHINGDRNPDLSFNGSFRNTEKFLYSQILLDPFKEQFHLPSALVQICYGSGI
jgi:hypothetical protein